MRETKAERSARFYRRMTELGFSYDEATTLRRIEMTLTRWGEMECGDSDNYGSWAIVRGRKEIHHGQHANGHGAHHVFVHDDDGQPFMETHHYMHGHGKDTVSYSKMADRERGALKRLTKIMANHPDLWSYHQSDPRGCALYVGRKSEMNGDDLNCCYTRGVAVCI